MLFTEDFLHYVWKFRLFDRADLQTTTGDAIEVGLEEIAQEVAIEQFHLISEFRFAICD